MNAAIIRFGAGNSATYKFEGSATIQDAIACSQIRQELGYPNNVRARVDSVEQDVNDPLHDGDVVDLETVGTSKAVTVNVSVRVNA